MVDSDIRTINYAIDEIIHAEDRVSRVNITESQAMMDSVIRNIMKPDVADARLPVERWRG